MEQQQARQGYINVQLPLDRKQLRMDGKAKCKDGH